MAVQSNIDLWLGASGVDVTRVKNMLPKILNLVTENNKKSGFKVDNKLTQPQMEILEGWVADMNNDIAAMKNIVR